MHATAAAVQLTLPVFFVGLAISQLFFGSVAGCGQARHLLFPERLVLGSAGTGSGTRVGT